jgi:hypothetical protein
VTLWTLRGLLAPIVESIILIDRWLYLNQSIQDGKDGHKGVWMYPLFDVSASPRKCRACCAKLVVEEAPSSYDNKQFIFQNKTKQGQLPKSTL